MYRTFVCPGEPPASYEELLEIEKSLLSTIVVKNVALFDWAYAVSAEHCLTGTASALSTVKMSNKIILRDVRDWDEWIEDVMRVVWENGFDIYMDEKDPEKPPSRPGFYKADTSKSLEERSYSLQLHKYRRKVYKIYRTAERAVATYIWENITCDVRQLLRGDADAREMIQSLKSQVAPSRPEPTVILSQRKR
ncbi:hypothetical protein FQN50_008955 [Emmonsiellopsis sp. PD_5]|nr:hypothetical protein FQN50_008955 [Emmonsiellopsis sp. PD_5]